MRVLLCLFLATSGLFGTAYTGSASGNWNSAATWGGAGVPGNGDTVTINDGVVVTIPAGYQAIVGTSPTNDSATPAIQCASAGGSGQLVVNGTLTFRGSVRQCGATWTVAADAIVEHDSSLATTPSSANYSWKIGQTDVTPAYLVVSGTAGHPAIFRKAAGSGNSGGFGTGGLDTGILQATYATISDWGTSSIPLLQYYPYSNGRTIYCDHCQISGSGRFYDPDWMFNGTQFRLNYTTVRMPLQGNVIDYSGSMQAASIIVSNSVLEGAATINGATDTSKFQVSNSILGAVGGQGGMATMTDSIIYSNSASGGGANYAPSGNWTRMTLLRGCNAAASPPCSDNPHWMDYQNMSGGNLVLNGVLVDFEGTTGQGDIFQFANPGSLRTVSIQNLVTPLINGGTTGVGTLVNLSMASTNYVNLQLTMTHITFSSSSPGSGGAIPVWAENNGSTASNLGANTWTGFKDNIVYGTDGQGGISYIAASSPSLFTYAAGSYVGFDYNARYGLGSTPYISASFPGPPAASAYDTTPGTHDITAAPGFLQARRFLDYCRVHDTSITSFDACIAKFKAMNDAGWDSYYDMKKMYAWVQAGYAPTNLQYFTGAHDGSYVGATAPSLQFGYATISAQ